MKNANQCEKNLSSLLKKLGTPEVSAFPDPADPIAVLVYSYMLWETKAEKAVVAYRKIMDNVVDLNDLRVTMPHELESWIGVRYARSLDRCQRLRATLRDVYLREHSVNLDSLPEMGKRDVRKYVESLNGIVPYVASRLMLLCCDVHAMPVDEQLRTHLVDAGVVDVSAEVPEIGTWLARQVKAQQGAAVHVALQGWVETRTIARRKTTKKPATKKPAAKKPAAKKSAAKKSAGRSSKKTTAKKKTTKKKTVAKR